MSGGQRGRFRGGGSGEGWWRSRVRRRGSEVSGGEVAAADLEADGGRQLVKLEEDGNSRQIGRAHV